METILENTQGTEEAEIQMAPELEYATNVDSLSQRAAAFFNEREEMRKALSAHRDIEQPARQIEEVDTMIDLFKKLNDAEQAANALLTEANTLLPDDRLETGRSVYEKIELFRDNSRLIAELAKEWEEVKSEKKAVEIKKQLKEDRLRELETIIQTCGDELQTAIQGLERAVGGQDKALSGLPGLWNRLRGRTLKMADHRAICQHITTQLKEFMVRHQVDGHFFVPYASRAADILSTMEDPSYQTVLQTSGIDVQPIISSLKIVQEKVNEKASLDNENYGIDSDKVSSVRSKMTSLKSQFLSQRESEYPEELVREWRDVSDIHRALAIDPAQERGAANQASGGETMNEADQLERERSYRNIRESVFLYARSRFEAGISREAVLLEIQEETERVKETMVFAYNERAEDIEKIIDSGRIMNLFEHDAVEQKARKKSMSDVEEILQRRKLIDTALGWGEKDKVYHLVVDDASNDRTNGSANEYGSIRLQFDYASFADHSTFTESDSLNPNGLPTGLEAKRNISSASRGVVDRQVSAEHVPYAKAIFNLSEKHNPKVHGREMRYIEAQVGGITGKQLIDKLRDITIDMKEFTEETRGTKLNPLRIIEKVKAFCKERDIPLTLTGVEAV